MHRKVRRRSRIKSKPRFAVFLVAACSIPFAISGHMAADYIEEGTAVEQPIMTHIAALATTPSPTLRPKPTLGAALTSEPTPEPWWTEDDIDLLAAVISAEARGESYEGQLAVGCVILNRMEHDYWGDTIADVVYQKSQFAKPHWKYNETTRQVALDCLEGERIFPEQVLFFKQQKEKIWRKAIWYDEIGCHSFYAQTDFE